jgi:hypothetical protein
MAFFNVSNFHARAATSPPCTQNRAMTVFRKNSMTDLSRKWRQVDMTSIPGLSALQIYVDIDSCPVPPAGKKDNMVNFFEFVAKCMLKLGGALPLIVDNTFSTTCRDQLEYGLRHPLKTDELSRLTHELSGKSIYIFVDAVLLIYLSGLGRIDFAMDNVQFSGDVVGRGFKLTYELTHGMRMLRRLLESRVQLNWTRDGDDDWCIEKDQFMSLLSTPPKLGIATGINKGGDFPADAGRVWEHSITNGLAFFQRNFEIVIARNLGYGEVDYICQAISDKQAQAVILDPAILIQLSRDHAAAMERESSPSKIMKYAASSLPVTEFQYACSSSGWWMANQQ